MGSAEHFCFPILGVPRKEKTGKFNDIGSFLVIKKYVHSFINYKLSTSSFEDIVFYKKHTTSNCFFFIFDLPRNFSKVGNVPRDEKGWEPLF